MAVEVDSLGRWPGSKRWLPVLYPSRIPVPSPRGRCFDVFTGAGALAIHWLKQGRRVVMADANPRLIGCYRAIRDQPGPLVEALRDLEIRYRLAEQVGEAEAKARFGHIRDEMNGENAATLESAAGFLFVVRAGFNGVYRVNQQGVCNTPWGDPGNILINKTKIRAHIRMKDLVREDELRALHKLLQRATLHTGDFEGTCDGARRGDVVYFDPPYVADKGRPSFVSYAAGGFRRADQKRLATVLRDLDTRGVRWLLSDAATENAGSVYGLWNVTEVDVRRSCSGKSSGRGTARELLVSNG